MIPPRLVAASALVLLGCSAATSSNDGPSSQADGAAPYDTGTGVREAGSGPCDAGEPADIYATSQPFECNESLQTLATRGFTLAFDLVVPTGGQPTAVVILLPGGDGVLRLTATGIGAAADNFCVRTRQTYAKSGFVVAIPDVPSDRSAGLNNFRNTPQHATDLGHLVQHMQGAYPGLPVWMVSTSRGTISATNALANAPTKPDHVVLTSSVTFTPMNAADQENIYDVPNAEGSLALAVPHALLMIHDSLNACQASPPISGMKGSGAEALAEKIGDMAHFVLIDGGPMPPSAGTDPHGVCGGLAYHGFYGNDALVVSQKIIPFIQNH